MYSLILAVVLLYPDAYISEHSKCPLRSGAIALVRLIVED